MGPGRAQSVAEVLRRRLDPRQEPGRPLVTFYDDRSGERTELSVTTYANWVAKTAGVLVDDLDLVAGDRVRVALPTHWLGPVFLGAAWLAGMHVVPHDAEDAALVVEGPGSGNSTTFSAEVRLHCALLPFAVASREPMPVGVLDFGTLWPGQPDDFLGIPADPSCAAYDGRDQRALLDRAGSPDRVLTDVDPTSAAGIGMFLDALVGGGSIVLVTGPDTGPDTGDRGADPNAWSARATSERADRVVRAEPAHPPML